MIYFKILDTKITIVEVILLKSNIIFLLGPEFLLELVQRPKGLKIKFQHKLIKVKLINISYKM